MSDQIYRQTKPKAQRTESVPIIPSLSLKQQESIRTLIQKTPDKQHARRLMAILLFNEGRNIVQVHKITGAARSTLGRWLKWYKNYGLDGLKTMPSGRPTQLPVAQLQCMIKVLLEFFPTFFRYNRSRWSSELLAIELQRIFQCNIASSTIRKWLPQLGFVWRRAAPTLHIKDANKQEKQRAIEHALRRCNTDYPVFYEDEVDVHLNPKMGADWTPRGEQKRIPTPGRNQKRYLAGALHAGTGNVLYVESDKKDSALFIDMLSHLHRRYRKAKKITLIVDNYIIHKSRKTQAWLKRHPKIQLLFQPVYSPWINKIEGLWHKLHETVTRNHRCHSMDELMGRVRHFLHAASPFPGMNSKKLKMEHY